MVLAPYTTHFPDIFIMRNRKLPVITSTNGPSVHEIFKDSVQKELSIPTIISDYNHHMNGVDLPNQYGMSYETQWD